MSIWLTIFFFSFIFISWRLITKLRACTCAKSLQSHPTLCKTTDCILPGSSVHGIFQERILEWLPCSSPGDLPNPGIKPVSLMSPELARGGGVLYHKCHLGSPLNSGTLLNQFPICSSLSKYFLPGKSNLQ